VNAKHKYGLTPLHRAAFYGHKEVVEMLIAAGADVNAKDDNGDTPLDVAVNLQRFHPNNTEIAEDLRKHGGKTKKELNVLFDSIRTGNIEAVKKHIAAGMDVNAKDIAGSTPLFNAVLRSSKEIAELLIVEGADVNAKHKYGLTPLHRAAFYGHKEVVEMLIAAGADVNAKDDNGDTPLDVAVNLQRFHPNNTEIAEDLRKHGGKTKKELNVLFDSIRTGNIEAVKKHIAAGMDVNAKDIAGSTPLFNAVLRSSKEIAELLIVEGADVNAKHKYGLTPLHRAAFYGHKEVVEMLIAAGADVNAKDDNGDTPLDVAVNLQRFHPNNTEIAED
jgi:cytohesin